MGDLGELFNAQRAATKQHRRKMLAEADTTGWTQHTEWHYSRDFNGTHIDWWPSTGKARIGGKMVYGHEYVRKLIAQYMERENV